MMLYYVIENTFNGKYAATSIGNVRRFSSEKLAREYMQENRLSDIFKIRLVVVI